MNACLKNLSPEGRTHIHLVFWLRQSSHQSGLKSSHTNTGDRRQETEQRQRLLSCGEQQQPLIEGAAQHTEDESVLYRMWTHRTLWFHLCSGLADIDGRRNRKLKKKYKSNRSVNRRLSARQSFYFITENRIHSMGSKNRPFQSETHAEALKQSQPS